MPETIICRAAPCTHNIFTKIFHMQFHFQNVLCVIIEIFEICLRIHVWVYKYIFGFFQERNEIIFILGEILCSIGFKWLGMPFKIFPLEVAHFIIVDVLMILRYFPERLTLHLCKMCLINTFLSMNRLS